MVNVEEIKLATQLGKTCMRKRFDEDVCELMASRDVLYFDDVRLYLFADEVSVDLNMLGCVVMNKILSNAYGCLIITKELDRPFDFYF